MSTRTSQAIVTIADFEPVIELLEIQNTDFLLISDGSCVPYLYKIGWYGVLYIRHSQSIRHFSGSMSPGKVLQAEFMPLQQAGNWILTTQKQFIQATRRTRSVLFDVLTDNASLRQRLTRTDRRRGRYDEYDTVIDRFRQYFRLRAHRPYPAHESTVFNLCHLRAKTIATT